MLSIRIPAKMERRLNSLSRKTGRTKTFYAREAILTHLDDIELAYLAERRAQDLDDGRVEAIPLEDVKRELGL